MALPFRLPEQAKIVDILQPAADAAGRTGTYVRLKHGHKVYFVCKVAQGAANTVQFSVQQAQDKSGTGAKAAPSVPNWANEDTSTATGTDTLVKQADAASYTTGAATKNKMVVFEVDPDYLDVANSFWDVTMVTGASSASNVTECTAYVIATRYAMATPPTVILD